MQNSLREEKEKIKIWQKEVLFPLIPPKFDWSYSQIQKIEEELKEVKSENSKDMKNFNAENFYLELADCFIVCCGIAVNQEVLSFIIWEGIKTTFNFSEEILLSYLQKKMKINKKRQWYFDEVNNVIKHKPL